MCDGYGVVVELVYTQRWSYNRGDSSMVEYTIGRFRDGLFWEVVL